MSSIPFCITDWSEVESTGYGGEVGLASWRTRRFGDVRVSGELHTEIEDGRAFTLRPGTNCQVAGNAGPHRSHASVDAPSVHRRRMTRPDRGSCPGHRWIEP
jgi:hypothetical protein